MTTYNAMKNDLEYLRMHLEVETDSDHNPNKCVYYSADANKEHDPYMARFIRLRDMRKQLADLREIRRIRIEENAKLSDEITELQLQFDRECANEAGY